MICIIDDCINTDFHKSKKEISKCKKYFKKNYNERKTPTEKFFIIKSRIKVDNNCNIIDVEILEE